MAKNFKDHGRKKLDSKFKQKKIIWNFLMGKNISTFFHASVMLVFHSCLSCLSHLIGISLFPLTILGKCCMFWIRFWMSSISLCFLTLQHLQTHILLSLIDLITKIVIWVYVKISLFLKYKQNKFYFARTYLYKTILYPPI